MMGNERLRSGERRAGVAWGGEGREGKWRGPLPSVVLQPMFEMVKNTADVLSCVLQSREWVTQSDP